MKFGFVEQHRETHSVGKMARILGVSRGGYYAWRCGARSERSRAQDELVRHIEGI